MYSMKGVLNLQLRDALPAALRQMYRDEKWIANSCRELADQEGKAEQHDLLMMLAKRAERNAVRCGVLLYRIGSPIRPNSLRARGQQTSRPRGRLAGRSAMEEMERLENADFRRLFRLCSAQRRWV